MCKKAKGYFTTGEFAKLCRTTKETLFHYDTIGILKPDHIGQNNYRYYSVEQFYDYDLIATLKTAGCSLSEIKNYLHRHNVDDFIKLLNENRKRLQMEQEKLERMNRLLENAVTLTKEALSKPYHQPEILYCEEEYFIATKLDKKETLSSYDEIYYINNHFSYCEEKHIYSEYPIGVIVLMDTLAQGQCSESYYSNKLEKPLADERLFVKPNGKYVSMLHQGYYDTRDKAYTILFDYIKKNHLTICGNGYEQELISYLAVEDINNLVTQIFIQVE